MNSPVQQIKERLSIEEIVSSYIKLDQAGTNLRAKCPFHNEKTPSFFVSPARGSYYCFGCGASGDIFTFVEEFEGLDFKGALKFLAERAQVPLGHYSPEEDQKSRSEKERLYDAMEESTKFFSENLDKNSSVQDYLRGRGLTDASIKNFRIGYVSPLWRSLYLHLQKKGFTDIEMERAGLVKKIDKATSKSTSRSTSPGEQGFYDRFRGRIIFPMSDSSGRVIAFSGRLFEDNKASESGASKPQDTIVVAKYINSPDTPIFSKHQVLYGLDKAKESIRKNNFSILVEGQMDLVLSHQAGYHNTIATSGTALSDATVSKDNAVSNLGLIRRLSPNIVIAFDGDEAGIKAANRASRIALSLGMDVKVASMPSGMDPADLILESGRSGMEGWRSAIRDSKHIIEFLLDKVMEDTKGDTRKTGRVIKDTILPIVSLVDSSIEKMHFLKKISDVSGIPEVALGDDLKKVEKETQYEKRELEQVEESLRKRKDYILRKLLSIILWQKSLASPDVGRLGPRRPTSGDADEMLKETAEILNMTGKELLDGVEEDKADLIFEAEVFYGDGADLKKDTAELMLNLREECLREELEQKMRELRQAEEAKNTEKSTQILAECQTINNKIQGIKNNRHPLDKSARD